VLLFLLLPLLLPQLQKSENFEKVNYYALER